MSIASWKKEFYTTPAEEVSESRALAHSIKKWTGLLKKNMKRHGVSVYKPDKAIEDESGALFYVSDETCALCVHHYDRDCKSCPLYAVNNNRPCDFPKQGSAYDKFISDSDARPMLRLLKAAAKKKKKKKKHEAPER